MKLKILSWNVRGANDVVKRKVIKAFLKSQKVDVVCLKETKLKDLSRGTLRSLAVGRYMEWATTYSEGASEGILIMWDNRVLQLVGVEESCFTLSCKFRNSEDNFTWVFTGVYGAVKKEQREDLWGELGAVKAYGGIPGA